MTVVMMISFNQFFSSKSHAIHIYFHGIPFHFITVVSSGFILFNKLTAVIRTNVILLTFLDAIFTEIF